MLKGVGTGLKSITEEFYNESLLLGFDFKSIIRDHWEDSISTYHLVKGFQFANNGYDYLNDLRKLKIPPEEIYFYKSIVTGKHPLGLSIDEQYLVSTEKERINHEFTFAGFSRDKYRAVQYKPELEQALIFDYCVLDKDNINCYNYLIDAETILECIKKCSHEEMLDEIENMPRASSIHLNQYSMEDLYTENISEELMMTLKID